MKTVEEIQAYHATISDRINSSDTTEVVVDQSVLIQQMGLSMALVDKLGRIWMEVEPYHLKMIFDPAWLHPSKRWKRWNGPRVEREVPKTRSPK